MRVAGEQRIEGPAHLAVAAAGRSLRLEAFECLADALALHPRIHDRRLRELVLFTRIATREAVGVSDQQTGLVEDADRGAAVARERLQQVCVERQRGVVIAEYTSVELARLSEASPVGDVGGGVVCRQPAVGFDGLSASVARMR